MFASTSNFLIVVTFTTLGSRDIAARNAEIRFLDSNEVVDVCDPQNEHIIDMACDLIADDFHIGNVYFAA